jgi:hypothetical protein
VPLSELIEPLQDAQLFFVAQSDEGNERHAKTCPLTIISQSGDHRIGLSVKVLAKVLPQALSKRT